MLYRVAFCLMICAAAQGAAMDFERVELYVGEEADAVEQQIVDLFAARLSEVNGLPVRIQQAAQVEATAGTLTVLLGIPAHHATLQENLERLRIPALTAINPGVEGFVLKSLPGEASMTVLAAGIDQRGVLYAVGELLRQVQFTTKGLQLADDLDLRTAPAFEVRGTQFGQSHIAKSKAMVRDWTEEETQRMILDYALAGANVFSCSAGPYFDFLKSYGLMTQGGFGANTGGGPEEWLAKESIGRKGYLCLSVPDARAHMLEKCENQFKNSPTFDFIKFHGGDGGGCECDRCDPYGGTFIRVVEQMAAIIHKYHPETRIYFTNQKFDDADDIAIFEYLQEEPRDWLWAWGYGPGSDGMGWQPGHRQTHRMDLFRYPGMGPFGRYCQEIIHQLPPQQVLIFYTENTHWRYSQHGYAQMYPRADRDGNLPPHWNHFIYDRRPDQYLTMVYDRLTFYAWPRYYHWVFQQLLPYGVGDITHSSGHHDHFNQWSWQRMLWAPHTPVEALVDEYCRTFFGEAATPFMARALFQLEENLEEDLAMPLTEKKGIERYYTDVKMAGEKIPAHLMKNNWLWREYMQKGALDLYTKLAVRQQMALQERVEKRIVTAFEDGKFSDAIDEVLAWIVDQEENDPMRQLREEAERLGEESNALYGVRSEGLYNLKHDFIGLGWLARQLERAKGATGDEQRELLWTIAHYEDAGAGGQYDNAGTLNPAPNIVNGYPYDHGQPYVPQMLSEANRHSQRSMHFTQDEAEGVALRYTELDPKAEYRIRLSLMRPWFQDRYSYRMHQKRQSIYADGIPLAEELELPERMSDFFSFTIPAEALQDGEVVIQFKKGKGVAEGSQIEREIWRNAGGWGTILSEAWLMRKDSLPWRE